MIIFVLSYPTPEERENMEFEEQKRNQFHALPLNKKVILYFTYLFQIFR